jgi:hypothetical protein
MTTPDLDIPDNSARETRVVDVRGRSIVIRSLLDTQLLSLNHEARILQRADIEPERKMKGMERMFKALLSVVVQASDQEYLEDLMAEGTLDLRELTTFATSFLTDQDEAPKVRRGRPAKRATA